MRNGVAPRGHNACKNIFRIWSRTHGKNIGYPCRGRGNGRFRYARRRVGRCQFPPGGVSNLVRNVPFLTPLEMAPFLLNGCCPGVSAEAKPCAAVGAAVLGRSGGGHPSRRWCLPSIHPLELHSLFVTLPPRM